MRFCTNEIMCGMLDVVQTKTTCALNGSIVNRHFTICDGEDNNVNLINFSSIERSKRSWTFRFMRCVLI